jgi:hypothetical protein
MIAPARGTMDAMTDRQGARGGRDQFIPARKIDIVRGLIGRDALGGEPESQKFQQLCRLLGSIYHYEYFDRLERLRDDYFYFNPEFDGHKRYDRATIERAYRDLLDAFLRVLHGANFVEIDQAEIERAHRERVLIPVSIQATMDGYREVRFFRRGHHRQTFEISEWFGWRKRSVEADVYDDVVLLVATANDDGSAPNPKKRRSDKSKVRPGAMLLKYFRNIASADLNALVPDVRVVMGLGDRLWIGVPAIIGGVPILIKLASTITVLFLVAGFYLGLSSAVKEEELGAAIAALSALVALGGLIVRQWVKFQRQSLLYHKMLSDNIYFRNVNNNAGTFDYIICAAEEQDCKETFLAYHFLLAPGDGPTQDALDRRIETWLLQSFGIDIDFECDDAIGKLNRLGLLRRDGERLFVLPLDEALMKLDGVWDAYFQFRVETR